MSAIRRAVPRPWRIETELGDVWAWIDPYTPSSPNGCTVMLRGVLTTVTPLEFDGDDDLLVVALCAAFVRDFVDGAEVLALHAPTDEDTAGETHER